MNLKTSSHLTPQQVQSGLKNVVREGVAAEIMVNLTGGTFLVAMAIHLGASNFQIGLLASLPILTNIFQLISVWLVKKYQNRRAISVITSFIARFALIIIGLIPFFFTGFGGVEVLIFLLSIHYLFGSIAGGTWNSWMKDLVPDSILGKYFSHRTRIMQIVGVSSNLLIAFTVDFIKARYPEYVTNSYFIMVLIGAIVGMIGVYLLSRADEPAPVPAQGNFLRQLIKPLRDVNFRNLLVFNSFWSFALNLAVPFFTVFMMKTIGLSLTYIMALTIIGQLSSIFSVKMWGRYADRYSNKTIINICAPLYILCILAMAFAAAPAVHLLSVLMLVLINVFSGISTAGINLALNNIGMKLAPQEDATAYISAKNIIISIFSAVAPLVGGLAADFFTSHSLVWNIEWKSGTHSTMLNLVNLQGWNFFFIIGGALALFSLRTLVKVRENGEVQKGKVVLYMRSRMRKNIARGAKRSLEYSPAVIKGFRHMFT
ncbi:MFS transporter [Flavihumibacter sp. R14]|nr:MFS transporter [Flavihumibacter soli]